MRPLLGVVAAGLLAFAGWQTQGWAGVALVVTMALFLGLLQFHRAIALLRRAAQAPLGWVPSAVMLHSKLRAGLSVAEVMKLAGSIGQAQAAEDGEERLAWRDPGDAEVVVRVKGGKVVDWTLQRP